MLTSKINNSNMSIFKRSNGNIRMMKFKIDDNNKKQAKKFDK